MDSLLNDAKVNPWLLISSQAKMPKLPEPVTTAILFPLGKV